MKTPESTPEIEAIETQLAAEFAKEPRLQLNQEKRDQIILVANTVAAKSDSMDWRAWGVGTLAVVTVTMLLVGLTIPASKSAQLSSTSVQIGQSTQSYNIASHPGKDGMSISLSSGVPSAPMPSMSPPSGKIRMLEKLGGLQVSVAGEERAVVRRSLIDEDNYAPTPPYPREHNTESYTRIEDNPFLAAIDNPLSTFSIDVDTASYSNVRRFLERGSLPPKDAVRIEELLNYFHYDYAGPRDDKPFAVHLEATASPWNPENRLVRIGLKGRELDSERRPSSNLVFLIDVSGSMQSENKLPLVQRGLRMLVNQLETRDSVALVVYAGSSGLVLPSTSAKDKAAILEAIDRLSAGGSTNGAQGIELAYATAQEQFIKGGVNRVILATDGDFNVGITDEGSLTRLIEEKAKTGIFLSVLGFGMGNYQDSRLEKLADKGNGNYAYIDSIHEARKVLVEQMCGTLVTIAKDVKIQVEFNPTQVASYRLIGYENRMLRKEDFNDDNKDAGEIGAGHTVTALYEVVPAGGSTERPSVDPLKYLTKKITAPRQGEEMLTVKLRYKTPEGSVSSRMDVPFTDQGLSFDKASDDLRFAAAVAGFGMVLRDSPNKGVLTLGQISAWAGEGKGEDAEGYRREFIKLVKLADALL